MFCIDDVRTVSLPHITPARSLRCPSSSAELDELENDATGRGESDQRRVHANLRQDGQVELIREPRLADNYKFTLPLPGKEPWETIEANYISGRTSRWARADSRDRASRSNGTSRCGAAPARSTTSASQWGSSWPARAMRFTLRMDNQTPYQFGEVFFPDPRWHHRPGQEVSRPRDRPCWCGRSNRGQRWPRQPRISSSLRQSQRVRRPGTGTILSLSPGRAGALDGALQPRAAPLGVSRLARSCPALPGAAPEATVP